jgi:hypothetical protein
MSVKESGFLLWNYVINFDLEISVRRPWAALGLSAKEIEERGSLPEKCFVLIIADFSWKN